MRLDWNGNLNAITLFLLLIIFITITIGCAVELGVRHTVREGETLWSVSRAYDVRMEAIMRANGINNARQVESGMKLVIPGVVEEKVSGDERRAKAPDWEQEMSGDAKSSSGGNDEVPPSSEIDFSPVWPVKGRLIQRFRSRDKAAGRGIRIEAPLGSKIKAIETGNIKLAGQWDAEEALGKIIIIYHNQEFASVYAHLDNLTVSEGESVERGQIIGEVGKSGMVDKPQCYLEIRYNLVPKDPMLFLEDSS